MTSKEILRALQAGEISLEEAKNQLIETIKTKPAQSTGPSAGRNTSSRSCRSAVALHEVAPGIMQVTMQDRVHKNAFSEELVSGLTRAFASLQADSNCKVVILTGYDTYFSGGGTREGLLAICEGKIKWTDTNIYRLALDCKVPVIAAMQGHAFGAGWSMGMFCDFLVMDRESVYAANYMKLGFTPGAGATLIFPEKFGPGLAQEILYTGKNYRGEELASKGIPFPVLPKKEVLPYAIRLAKTLAEAPASSLLALKNHMAESLRQRLSAAVEKEAKMHEKTFVNQPGVKERIQSLYGPLPKNPPTGSPAISLPRTKAEAVSPGDSIAIIGMSGQFPKSKTLDAFWDNLARGRDCISEIPASRWPGDTYYSPDPEVPGKTDCKWMGVLEDMDRFDPLFFNISPAEAALMDPQQRLFLENCWRCVEDSGYSPSSLSGSRCGVFVGCAANNWGQLLGEQGLNAQGLLGESLSILSARISYFLNLKGPCLAIDTACSSSLVALAEACNSLVLQTSDLALAGGVCVMTGPAMHIMTAKAGMLSRQGRCFTFDNRADGFVPGEGVGVLLLKRLHEALRDSDHIYGVIRGWGINQDGKTNGITAPSANSQILLAKEVYQRFKINPETISLLEAHGTGTKLGDPIEVEALTESFRVYTQKKDYCALGSVKSNIGHLLAAAGAAGVIKVLLALQHRMLPPTIHFETLNEHIFLDNSPFYINRKLQPWKVARGVPRRAGISSFGFSGTNAHMVIEEYLPGSEVVKEPVSIDIAGPLLFVLSAKSKEQLKIYAQQMKHWAESREDFNLADMAYTLQVGREAMEHRLALEAVSSRDLIKGLAVFIGGNPSTAVFSGWVKKSRESGVAPAANEEAQALVETWINRGKMKEIAAAWVEGMNVDWNRLYSGSPLQKPRRVSLPSYPFAGERCWPIGTGETDQGRELLPASVETRGAEGTLLLEPVWEEQAVPGREEVAVPAYAHHLVILCEPGEIHQKKIESRIPGVRIRCLMVKFPPEAISQRFLAAVELVFTEIQYLCKDKSTGKVLIQVVVPFREEQQLFSGLAGFLKSAHLENPKLIGQLIEIGPGESPGRIPEILAENSLRPGDRQIRCQQGKRWAAGWEEINVSQTPVELHFPWKDRGVYLIAGGAGGLGMIFAREIARQVKDAILVLTGRPPLDPNRQAQIKELEKLGRGGRTVYRQVDVTQKKAVQELVCSIPRDFGSLNGIIHCAGVIRDNFIIKKNLEELQEVLGPKVTGLVNLDEASQNLELDFFILFSSAAGATGNSGQADYAAANAFMDAYAGYRNLLVASKQRQGQTLSINWPLWKEGRMHVDEETGKIVKQHLGMTPLPTSSGIRAFYQSFASGKHRVMVMQGHLARIRHVLVSTKGSDSGILVGRVQAELIQAAARFLGVKGQEIDMDVHFSECGFDPVALSEFANILSAEYKLEVPALVFFHHPTFRAAARCLVEEYNAAGSGLAGTRAAPETTDEDSISRVDSSLLREKTLYQLKVMLGEVTRLSIDRIDPRESLETYGIDSLMVTRLNEKLAAVFGELSKTLFFEYRTLGELAGYLLADYPQECMKWTGSLPPELKNEGWKGRRVEGGKVRRLKASGGPKRLIGPPCDGVAIIGMSGRFPGANTLEEFWENLKTGKDCITGIPPERWPLEGFFHLPVHEAVAQGKSYCKWGGFLEGFADFDPQFFNISPREALNMDPQERLFIQACWEVLEDAGCTREQLAAKYNSQVGVFAGITKTGFDLYGPDLWRQGKQIYPYTSFSSVANRISYLFNLKGPSMPIDTMCSSSLTAIHEACEYLRRRECEMAIAGGVNLYLHPANYIALCSQYMLSPDGQCKSFGKDSNGFVPGEGVGVVLLKPLSRAIADHDHIYAVIRGTAINHDGKTNGYTVPNPIAQGELIGKALEIAGINARAVSYVEAHGTGTELGDPIEITGLCRAFRKDTRDKGFCAIGSVKSNIGHLEASAGIAGVAKIILQMKYQQIVPSLHAGELNPNIDFSQTPFVVQQELAEWKPPTVEIDGETREFPRIAGISSFGAGGANAHVLIEEYIAPAQEPAQMTIDSENPVKMVIVPLSAKNEGQLRQQVERLLIAIKERPFTQTSLADIAYTLQVGREAMEERLAVMAGSIKELCEKLEGFLEDRENIEYLYRGQVKRHKETLAVFTANEEIQEAIDKWVQRRKFAKLPDLWVKGLDIDWEKLYSGIKHQKPRRISLPTYPFTGKRFWIPPVDIKLAGGNITASPTIRERSNVSLPPLRPTTAPPSNLSNIPDKPRGVSLRSLSPGQIPAGKPVSQAQPPITSPSPGISLSQPGLHEQAGPVTHLPRTVSVESLREELAESLADALFLDPGAVDVDKNFFDMGLDSIVGVEWIRTINKKYGTSIAATSVYDYSTIVKFAGFLEKELEKQKKISPATGELTREIDPVKKESQRSSQPSAGEELIAIVGMSARYPGARDLDQYWDNLARGKNSIREIPVSRWDVNRYYDPRPLQKGKIYCKWLGLLEDIDYFDPIFFNISPAEAEVMDPQQRLFLQEAYKAFEDAGYASQALSEKKCGVYLGIMSNEYSLLLVRHPDGVTNTTGSSFAITAARIAYHLNLKGPAIPLDTACSSSLVAAHLACQALKNHEIHMALVGGVTLYLTPAPYIAMCSAGMLSPQGQCKAFDNSANGFVPAEGVGAMVLKRLKDAEADGDSIYGVIIGSGINQDGKTNGITAPSVNSQMELEREVLDKYKIDPGTISYVEMHGTGTKLGDPVELEALSTVFKERTNQKNFCAIGSVKTNIGHTSAAAGLASLQKILLCMKHKKLVPTLNYKTPNEHFNFEDSPFYVNTRLKSWGSAPGTPRHAAVSSFGFSGTNAHMVIEEYLPGTGTLRTPVPVDAHILILFLLSAQSREQLKIYAQDMKRYIESHKDLDLADLAYTLQVGREAMDYRLAFLADSREAIIKALAGFYDNDNRPPAGVLFGQVKKSKDGVMVMEADEDAEALLHNWIQKRKLRKIAELWVKGLEMDWSRLYNDVKSAKPRRTSLPTYPFARERYWVPGLEPGSAGDAVVNTAVGASPGETPPVHRTMYFLKKHWESCSAAPTRELKQRVALLATPGTRALATLLSPHFIGSSILHLEDIQSQLRQPGHPWKDYDGCVDLTGCGIPDEFRQNREPEWTAWLRQLVEQGHKDELMMLCVTRGLESYRNRTVNLSGAWRVGLYRMLQSEYSHLRSRHMDADPGSDDNDLVQQIAVEFFMDSQDPEVCYRDGERFRACLREVPAGDGSPREVVFPGDQVLWITGGTRGLGALCARHFTANRGVKRLVLTGREPMPPRDQWEAYREQDTALARKIQSLQALEARGVQVQVLSVPLTDEQALLQGLQEVKTSLGPIGGVIHCAGLMDTENPAFIRKSGAGIQRVLAPKVDGLDLMVQLFKNEPLQFFVLFSSVSAIIPALAAGQSDYAMGNAYMDYVAEANHLTCPMISIQWPAWKETGMGEARSRVYQQAGLLNHTDAEGLELLDRILTRQLEPVVLPAVVDPVLWDPTQLLQRTLRWKTPANPPVPHPPAAELTHSPETLVNAAQSWLISLFARELKIDPSRLEIHQPFQNYGVDSIFLAQILQRINRQVRAAEDFDLSLLYEYPTIESLAAWLAHTHATSLAGVLAPPAVEPPAPPAQDLSPVLSLPSSFSPGEAPARGFRGSAHLAEAAQPADIAVIGLSCRFPGAPGLEEYWKLLSEGRSAIRQVPPERWGYSTPFYAGLLDPITHFDSNFFLVPVEDARAMDPQALVVLEESLNLFYHAGYTHEEIMGKPLGVYLGGRSQHRGDESQLDRCRNPLVAVGQNYLAANISQFFDLRGPVLVLDTACSSALAAMHTAIQSLHSGEIESALVGGVSLLNTDGVHRLFQQRNLLSREPFFHIFDRRAGGVVLGEGVGIVLLKTLSRALAEGDRIYAVIKALALNNDGRTAGPAAPNPEAQKKVMEIALARSCIKPGTISYIEANGSGSQVTDLLELKAIRAAYRPGGTGPVPCGLGSMKPNIGHPLCAEGMAGFIKVVLMLVHGQWVPFLSGQQPMRHDDMASSPFVFCSKLTPWTASPRVAAINCFADGGTNAHAILEAWEDPVSRPIHRQPLPPPLLARQDLGDGKTVTPANPDINPDSELTLTRPGPGTKLASYWKQMSVEQ